MKYLYLFSSDERRLDRIDYLTVLLEYQGTTYTKIGDTIGFNDIEYTFKTLEDRETIRGEKYAKVVIEELVTL